MPPKTKFSQEDILKIAFETARNEGVLNLSARTIAEKLGSSTSPIYSLFESMEAIKQGICKMSTELLLQYQMTPRTGHLFMDMGIGYIIFAKKEKKLFRDMFMNIDKLKPFSQGMIKYAHRELMNKVMTEDSALKDLSIEQKSELLQTMWFFAYGIATQINIEAFEKSEEEIFSLLRKVTISLIENMKQNH